MVFPRAGHPHVVDVYRFVADGLDADDNPQYKPQLVVKGRQGRFNEKRTRSDRLVADGVNISGVVVFAYQSGDVIENEDELVLRLRDADVEPIRFKVYSVQRQDMNLRPAFWEVEVVRHR